MNKPAKDGPTVKLVTWLCDYQPHDLTELRPEILTRSERETLGRMVLAGKVRKLGHGRYQLVKPSAR